ncbi:MAG: hypothetical protein WAM29_02230, partial [Methylocella sp.]
ITGIVVEIHPGMILHPGRLVSRFPDLDVGSGRRWISLVKPRSNPRSRVPLRCDLFRPPVFPTITRNDGA